MTGPSPEGWLVGCPRAFNMCMMHVKGCYQRHIILFSRILLIVELIILEPTTHRHLAHVRVISDQVCVKRVPLYLGLPLQVRLNGIRTLGHQGVSPPFRSGAENIGERLQHDTPEP